MVAPWDQKPEETGFRDVYDRGMEGTSLGHVLADERPLVGYWREVLSVARLGRCVQCGVVLVAHLVLNRILASSWDVGSI